MLFCSDKNVFRLYLVAALPLLIAACSHDTAGDRNIAPAVLFEHGQWRVPEKSPLRTRLKIQDVVLRDVNQPLVAPAMVEADPAYTINVLPPLTGRIAELKVALGDRVTRGQVLAVIISGDYAQAISDQAKAADALALAKKAFERADAVKQAGGAAEKDLEGARSTFAQAQAEYARAQTHLASLGASTAKGDMRRMQVLSPTDGSITALSAAAGAFANDPNAALMTVTDLDHVWVTANVAENEARMVAPRQPVDVTLPAWPGREFHGTVQSVSAVLDADSRRIKARIAVPNQDAALKPNMFATATFQVPRPRALLVPQSALLMNNDNVTVLVEVSPWVFERRAVELGDDVDNQARITKGLRPGDRIVAAGGVLIND